jgi:hypothetical protein
MPTNAHDNRKELPADFRAAAYKYVKQVVMRTSFTNLNNRSGGSVPMIVASVMSELSKFPTKALGSARFTPTGACREKLAAFALPGSDR